MLRVKLERLEDGRILVTLTVGSVILLNRQIHLGYSDAVILEVSDE